MASPWRLPLSLCVASMGLMLTSGTACVTVRAQDSPAVTTQILTVGSLNELRARTPDEEARAKYFDRFGSGASPISESLATGLVTISMGVPPLRVRVDDVIKGQNLSPEEIALMKERERRQLDEMRRAAVCGNDAIVIGRATPVRVLMTHSENWLFTDYSIEVDRWIRRRVQGNRTPSATVERLIGSQPGGDVMIAGKRVATIYSQGMPLGTSSLFMMKEIPGGGGYTVSTPHPGSNGKVWDLLMESELTVPEYIAETSRDAATCISTVR